MNMQSLMAQAQKVQGDIKRKQEELNNMEFEGKSEWVTMTISGKKEVKALNIDKTHVKDPEDLEMLEDMIVIAFNDAINKLEAETKAKLGMYGEGLSGLM